MPPHLGHEQEQGFYDGKVVCGVDEVGRGCIAGVVVAAAVVLPNYIMKRGIIKHIDDSKKLSSKSREEMFSQLTAQCLWSTAKASVAEIDSLNILQASMLAMQRAVYSLSKRVNCDHALIDGNRIPLELPCAATAIVGGDGISISIAAASIIAKVVRDRIMVALSKDFTVYGWDRNAGYPTKEHVAALGKYGATTWHRKSFAPVKNILRKLENDSGIPN